MAKSEVVCVCVLRSRRRSHPHPPPLQSLPSDTVLCPYVDILASYNGGVHWAAGQGSVPVYYTAPIKAVPIYSSALAAVVWPQTLNNARISMASTLLSAVDSSTYYESAYDSLDVGAGKDLASAAMIKAVTDNQAKLLLMGCVAGAAAGRPLAAARSCVWSLPCSCRVPASCPPAGMCL